MCWPSWRAYGVGRKERFFDVDLGVVGFGQSWPDSPRSKSIEMIVGFPLRVGFADAVAEVLDPFWNRPRKRRSVWRLSE
ncbi:hypothetical protein [Rhodococcus erythropolis]